MNRKAARSTIDTIFVTLTLTLFAILYKFFSATSDFYPWLQPILHQPWAPPIISILLSVATFKIFFGFLSIVYKNFVENQIVFHSTSIIGDWCYELDISQKQSDAKKKVPRIGQCKIFSHNGTLKMSGVHWNPGEKIFTANLDTTLIKVSYPDIFIRYVAVGIREGEIDRDEGVFELRADPSKFGEKPKKITGMWTDIFPKGERQANCGTFKLIRKTDESIKVLEALGFPVNATPSEIVFEQALKRKLEKI